MNKRGGFFLNAGKGNGDVVISCAKGCRCCETNYKRLKKANKSFSDLKKKKKKESEMPRGVENTRVYASESKKASSPTESVELCLLAKIRTVHSARGIAFLCNI